MSCAIFYLYIRGVGNASSVGRLASLIKQFGVCFVALFEPMVSSNNMQKVARKIGFNGYLWWQN